jgi:hypothetical protein
MSSKLVVVKTYLNPINGEDPLGFNFISYNTQNLMNQVPNSKKLASFSFTISMHFATFCKIWKQHNFHFTYLVKYKQKSRALICHPYESNQVNKIKEKKKMN